MIPLALRAKTRPYARFRGRQRDGRPTAMLGAKAILVDFVGMINVCGDLPGPCWTEAVA
jgi:hypothetical protein